MATDPLIVFLDRGSLPAPLRRPGFAHRWLEYDQTRPAELADRLQHATIAICNKIPMGRDLLTGLPDLKLIAVCATGVNHVDLDACRDLGIAVTNIRDYANHSLPEHALMLMLALSRHLFAYRAAILAGDWQRADQFFVNTAPVRDLHGATLGIVGRGSLGQRTGELAGAFGMNVRYAERPDSPHCRPDHVPFDQVLATADIISLHLPATADNHHLIGRRELALMKPGALLINTARGTLVDEAALVEALVSGHLGGAGLDVLSKEPPRDGNPLLDLALPNLIITPHNSWMGSGAIAEMTEQLIANLEAFVAGTPRNQVI